MNGTVKFYNSSKGYGFIKGEDGKEYFVHKSGIKDDAILQDNQSVTFDVVSGERGPKAENVVVSGGAESEEEEE